MPEDKNKLSDSALFRQSIGNITPLADTNRIKPLITTPAKAPKHFQQLAGEQHASRELPFNSVEGTEKVSYCRPEVNKKTLRRLKQGQFLIEDSLDLHGLTWAQAQQTLTTFLAEQQQFSHRVALIIHGKGLSSDNKYPVLKNGVIQTLRNSSSVLAYCSALIEDGDSGALYVLFK